MLTLNFYLKLYVLQIVCCVGLFLGSFGWVHAQTSSTTPSDKITISEIGTGFSINETGHLLTANHIIQNAGTIVVFAPGDTKGQRAKVIKINKEQDLALIQINQKTKAIPILNWQSIPNGLEIFAFGYPNPSIQGRELKITSGLINSLEGLPGKPGLFQFSAPIQQGNSGGPVISADSGVVGLINGKLDNKKNPNAMETLQNVNFAVRSLELETFLKDANVSYTKRDINLSNYKKSHEIFAESQASVYTVVTIRGDINKKSQPADNIINLLGRLSSNQKPKLNGAFKAGFDSLLELGADQVLVKTGGINFDKEMNHLRSFDFILSFNTPKKLNEKDYMSLINHAKFNCNDMTILIVRQEYKESTFGTGNTLSALKRIADTVEAYKKINPKELQSFFYNEVCQKVVNADLISNAN